MPAGQYLHVVLLTRGPFSTPSPYTQAAIKLSISTENNQTFYVNHGDLLSRIMTGLAALLLGWMIYLKALKKFFKKKFPALQSKDSPQRT
jgi:hypothetical protein